IVVESSSQLVVNSPLIVDSLTFKAGITGTFSALLDNGITANKVRFLKTLNPSKWFFMSFPCNVDIAKIKRTDGAALIYNDDIFIKYYDGSNRSNGNYGANWLMMASNGTLLANHGYIIGLKDGLGDVELEFPLEPTLVATAESQRTVQVDGNQGTSLKTTDKGWNLVGQPYLSKFTGGNASNVNYMLFSDGGTTYTTYSKLVGGLPVIDPFAAYFIQVGEDANLPYIFGGGRQLAPSLVTTNFSDIVQINVTTATGTDNTNLIMDNDQSTAYQIGLDMEKWIGTGTAKPQVYTILGGINYSFNALPMSSVSNLLIGIYTQVAGSTTISVDATQSASLSKLLLTDNGVSPATITDLLTSNYSFTANAGTNNTRFAITAQRITTENNLIGNELDELGISMINDGLVLANLSPSTTVRVYDALGRLVVSKTANSNVMEIKLNAKGIYTIQLQSGTKSWTRKVVM
ncbi:MAG: T9SS type A sorting domain-containing protein, partial [Paludibacter sp.]